MSRVETFVSAKNLHSPHPIGSYATLREVRPWPGWDVTILVMNEGDSFTALGGEWCYGYRTPDGHAAAGFVLAPGDRATVVRTGLPASLAEWRVERA